MIYFKESNGEVWFRKTAVNAPRSNRWRANLAEERELIELL